MFMIYVQYVTYMTYETYNMARYAYVPYLESVPYVVLILLYTLIMLFQETYIINNILLHMIYMTYVPHDVNEKRKLPEEGELSKYE